MMVGCSVKKLALHKIIIFTWWCLLLVVMVILGGEFAHQMGPS